MGNIESSRLDIKGTKSEVELAVSSLAAACNLQGPSNISIRQGASYSSGYNEIVGYYLVNGCEGRHVRGQDGIYHESAHLVRLYNEKELNIGLNGELDRVSRLVDDDIEKGILGENYLRLCSLMFSKGASEEIVGCYFGLDREKEEALLGANEGKSQKTLIDLERKLNEWRIELEKPVRAFEEWGEKGLPIIIPKIKSILHYSKNLGKIYGGILGNWLVAEQVTEREVMLHDASKLLGVIKDLVAKDEFPRDLADFMRSKFVFEQSVTS
jgi:hypothetical protein